MEYLSRIVQLWLDKAEEAREARERDFGRTAARLWQFMGRSFTELYIEGPEPEFRWPGRDNEEPYYKPRINKTREFVNVMLPYVHAAVPIRLATPNRPAVVPDLLRALGYEPQEAMLAAFNEVRAALMNWWLNYTPTEYGAKREQRMTIQEALVKGRGVAWCELSGDPLRRIIPASFHDSVDGLLIDADARMLRRAGYIVRELRWPAWQLADQFGIDVEKIRAAGVEAGRTLRGRGAQPDIVPTIKQDVVRWYQVWSRVGVGTKLAGADLLLKDKEELFDELGPHVWLAIMPGLDYPLNLPPDALEVATDEEIRSRVAWPIPFYAEEASPFPVVPLDFYPNPDNPWATAPLEAVLPLQVALDQGWAYLLGRIRTTSRDIILTGKSIDEGLRNALLSGLDQSVVSVDDSTVADIERLVHIIQFPPTNMDAWRILYEIERAFERGSGMDPLIYGGQPSRQIRSAQEAGFRQAAVSNRPNDYADAVEEWQSALAAKEAQMARLYVKPHMVAPNFQETPTEDPESYGPLTAMWASLVNTDDPHEAAADLYFSVEAGTGRRKNKEKQISDLATILQTIAPVVQAFAMKGLLDPWNNLVDIIADTIDRPLGRLKIVLPQPQPTATKEAKERVQE